MMRSVKKKSYPNSPAKSRSKNKSKSNINLNKSKRSETNLTKGQKSYHQTSEMKLKLSNRNKKIIDESAIDIVDSISGKKSLSNNPLPSCLDSYQKVLNERINSLTVKWNEMKVLQQSLSYRKQNQSNKQMVYNVQNEFLVNKITQLQNELRKKQEQLIIARKKGNQIVNSKKQKQLAQQNRKIKAENILLEKENEVLKRKMKEFGIL